MPVDTSAWTSGSPTGSNLASSGDDQIRSDKSYIEAVVNEEHYFTIDSASSLSGGQHRAGSARAFYGTGTAGSQLSVAPAGAATGRLFFDQRSGSLHVMHASSASTLLGGTLPTGVILQISATSLQPDASGSALTLGAALYSVPANAYHTSGETQWKVPSGLSGLWRFDIQVVTEDDASAEHVGILVDDSGANSYLRGSTMTRDGGWADGYRRLNFSTVLVASSGQSFAFLVGASGVDPNVVNSGIATAGDSGTRIAMFRIS